MVGRGVESEDNVVGFCVTDSRIVAQRSMIEGTVTVSRETVTWLSELLPVVQPGVSVWPGADDTDTPTASSYLIVEDEAGHHEVIEVGDVVTWCMDGTILVGDSEPKTLVLDDTSCQINDLRWYFTGRLHSAFSENGGSFMMHERLMGGVVIRPVDGARADSVEEHTRAMARSLHLVDLYDDFALAAVRRFIANQSLTDAKIVALRYTVMTFLGGLTFVDHDTAVALRALDKTDDRMLLPVSDSVPWRLLTGPWIETPCGGGWPVPVQSARDSVSGLAFYHNGERIDLRESMRRVRLALDKSHRDGVVDWVTARDDTKCALTVTEGERTVTIRPHEVMVVPKDAETPIFSVPAREFLVSDYVV